MLFHIAFLNRVISVTLQDAVASLHNIQDECTPGIPRALGNLRLPMYMDIPHMPAATDHCQLVEIDFFLIRIYNGTNKHVGTSIL